MSYSRAINEVAGLLVQGGTPANHASDIAARLSHALEDYYNFRQSQGSRSELNANSANTRSFKNAFRSPESAGPGGKDGKDGEGAYAWAVGADGQDGTGQDGADGQDGVSGGDGVVVGGGGGLTIDIGKVSCRDLKQKLVDCGIKTGECDCKKMECGGMLAGKSLCQVVENQARELRRIRDRLDAIEKMLRDTVEC